VAEGMKVPFNVFKAACKGLIEADLREDLNHVKAPVLILWGDKDNFCFLADQETMASNLADVKLVTYENTGHALHWEKPARFANDLSQFIKKVSNRVK
jgi:non-heme chloroperoxidase